jgi:hypothetical protein
MAMAVYVLCAFTSGVCSFLLLRGYARSRVRLLLWTGLCFVCLTLHNIVLIIDVQVLPDLDLIYLRNAPALVGLLILLGGIIKDTK